jgi:hypothetical protein
MQNPIKTLEITNFGGRLTRFQNGDLNSGFAKYSTTFGVDSFSKPGNLTFVEQATSIGGSIVTDLIVASRVRLESAITYVYAIGHTGRLYKIQVNDLVNHNPNYDNPVLLATLANGQTFKYGGSIEFYGTTEKIFIGHDAGVTSIHFDGTSETVIGQTDSTHWIANVPRQSQQFVGSIFYGNGSQVAQIDSTETVVSYNKISPLCPTDMQVRDLDVSSDNIYLIATCTRAPLTDITAISPDTSSICNSDSLLAYWNGSDTGATSGTSIPSFEMSSYVTFGSSEYSFGYDISGGIVSTGKPFKKILSLVGIKSPLPNAANSNGNFVGWCVPEFNSGFLKASLFVYGALDEEFKPGFYRQAQFSSSLTGGDIVQVPMTILVSNFSFAGANSGYTVIASTGKMYISTLEYNGSTTAYKLYKFFNVPVGINNALAGVYETQTQLFSKKQRVSEVRVYMEPGTSSMGFTVALTGIDGSVISGTSQAFTAISGLDVVKYNPAHAPTAAIGVRITNSGTVAPVINKIEVDVTPAGR